MSDGGLGVRSPTTVRFRTSCARGKRGGFERQSGVLGWSAPTTTARWRTPSGRSFFYGSFGARMLGRDGPAPHDIDVMVPVEPDVEAVYEACTRVEAAVRRAVNPTILTPEEFAEASGFLDDVRSGPVVALIGEVS